MKVTPNGFDRKKISWLLEQDLEIKLTLLQTDAVAGEQLIQRPLLTLGQPAFAPNKTANATQGNFFIRICGHNSL